IVTDAIRAGAAGPAVAASTGAATMPPAHTAALTSSTIAARAAVRSRGSDTIRLYYAAESPRRRVHAVSRARCVASVHLLLRNGLRAGAPVRCGRVIAGPGSRAGIAREHLHGNAAPRAIPPRIRRHVSERVLMAELLRDAVVDPLQLRGLLWEERASAGLLRENLHPVVGFTLEWSSSAGEVLERHIGRGLQRHGVHHHSGPACKLRDIVVAAQAGGVRPVRQQHDGPPAHLLLIAARRGQLLQGDVEGVVQSGRSAGDDLTDGALHRGGVGRQPLAKAHGVAELDHAGAIA